MIGLWYIDSGRARLRISDFIINDQEVDVSRRAMIAKRRDELLAERL